MFTNKSCVLGMASVPLDNWIGGQNGRAPKIREFNACNLVVNASLKKFNGIFGQLSVIWKITKSHFYTKAKEYNNFSLKLDQLFNNLVSFLEFCRAVELLKSIVSTFFYMIV